MKRQQEEQARKAAAEQARIRAEQGAAKKAAGRVAEKTVLGSELKKWILSDVKDARKRLLLRKKISDGMRYGEKDLTEYPETLRIFKEHVK